MSDRESDINAYLGEAVAQKTDIVLRAKKRRVDKESNQQVSDMMLENPVSFTLSIEVKRNSKPTNYKKKKTRLKHVESRMATLDVRFQVCELAIEDREEKRREELYACIHGDSSEGGNASA